MLTMMLKYDVSPDGCFGCNCQEQYDDKNYKIVIQTDFSDDATRASVEGLDTKFCEYITSPSKRNISGYIVRLLIEFTSKTPKLCKRLKSALKHTKEWSEIKYITENPRTLQHICREKIRQKYFKDKNAPAKVRPILQDFDDEYVMARARETNTTIHIDKIDNLYLADRIEKYLNFDHIQ